VNDFSEKRMLNWNV